MIAPRAFFTKQGTLALRIPDDKALRVDIKQTSGWKYSAEYDVWYCLRPDHWTMAKIFDSYDFDVDAAVIDWIDEAYEADRQRAAIQSDPSIPLPRIPLVRYPPWTHQQRAYAYLEATPNALLDMYMGTGKSRVIVDFVINHALPRVLIVCPLAVIPVWHYQFDEHAASPVNVIPLHGSTKQKDAMLRDRLAVPQIDSFPLVFVCNYESVWREPLGSTLRAHQWDMIVLDECFTAGTWIRTEQGDRKIEDIQAGDVVYGFDHASGTVVRTRVKRTFQGSNPYLLPFLGTLATRNHPVWTKEARYIPLWQCYTERYTGHTVLQLKGEKHVLVRLQAVLNTVYAPQTEQKILWQYLRRCLATAKAKALSVLWSRLHSTRLKDNVLLKKLCNALNPPDREKQDCIKGETKRRKKDASVSSQSAIVPTIGKQPVQLQASTAKRDPTNGFDSPGSQSPGQRTRGQGQISAGIHCHVTNVPENGIGAFRRPLEYRSGATRSHDSRGNMQGENVPIRKSDDDRAQEQSTEGERLGADMLYKKTNIHQPREGEARYAVYNLETATGNYFAQGLLVHNSHKIKAPGGKASRYLATLRDKADRRILLTGTPLPHSPLDIYGQYRFLDPAIFGTRFDSFRQAYAHMGGYGNHEVIEYINQDKLAARINRLRFHVAGDVLDLPPVVTTHYPVELDNKSATLYKKLSRELGADIAGGTVTIDNALVKILRLQQVSSGHIKDDNGVLHDLHTKKHDALAEYLSDIAGEEPVVVFCRFRPDLDAIRSAAEASHRPCYEYSGRLKELDPWKAAASVHCGAVLALQINAGSEGIDLTLAHYCVFYSFTHSLGQWEQAHARTHRPGQTHTVFNTYLECIGTVDTDILEALEDKKDVVQAVLDSYRRKGA